MRLLLHFWPIRFSEEAAGPGAEQAFVLAATVLVGTAAAGYAFARWHRMEPMPSKPSAASVMICACLACASMVAAVYFGGTGRIPLALIGTTLFVLLGGLAFELARRRSV